MVNKELSHQHIHITLLDCKNSLQNYVFFVINKHTCECAIIDPFDTKLIDEFINNNNLTVKYILNTHHHHDHIGGNNRILSLYPECLVYGHATDTYRIPTITNPIHHNQTITLFDGQISFEILNLDGHTLGHIGYYEPNYGCLFSGDTIFNLGCGRLFEGTALDYLSAFEKIKALPSNTLIYATHEYTLSNIDFVHSVMPKNYEFYSEFLDYCQQQQILRQDNKPTIPFTLKNQELFNPFLLYHNYAIKAHHNISHYNSADTIKYFRNLKDNY